MEDLNVLHGVHPDDFKRYDTARIRERFLLSGIMEPGAIRLRYTLYDRMIVGGIVPGDKELVVPVYPVLRSDYFLERREMGVINVGGQGGVSVDGTDYTLDKLDCLYIGKESRDIRFTSADAGTPAIFYILSAPAHARYPTTLLKREQAESNVLGSLETSNHRTIYRYIHKNGLQSCQLVMGLTLLEKGSVWNTIPPHTHNRRMEAYFYFDLPENQVVFHYMGTPDETRHILMKNHEAVVSPPWSIHAGSGTSSYGFIWGMAGENLEYSDMDAVNLSELR
ncbi:MAG TPA: 5-dehydro-4-deoxy-D-glucuronate isomerase [Flavisolibacter sp.]|jgi:4-deoxy-L-threo-5-hexosulose-uronate ketol-isomerase|nr:5-dehydro-4-deoxy-D-glucuronate isomerase [Flavisolibacter sp.]